LHNNNKRHAPRGRCADGGSTHATVPTQRWRTATLLVFRAFPSAPAVYPLPLGNRGNAPGADHVRGQPGDDSAAGKIPRPAAPISITIPLLSLTPAFTALAAIPLLGELPTPRQDAGIALVVGGAVVVHLRRDVALADRAAARRGALLMVLVALCWSVTPALDKLAVRASSAGLHGFVLCAGVAAAVLVILVARGRLGETREAARMPGTVAVALVLSALALGLQLVAIQLVWVSLVETLKRGLGNLAALAYGRWLLGEAISRLQVAGVGLMAAGVALILI
jgi:drug/metabolite transporter (DMT)-like permease